MTKRRDTAKRDDRGRPIAMGDDVCVVVTDSGRGALRWMHRGTVVGFGRSRVQLTFPSMAGTYAVGPECLRITDEAAARARIHPSAR